MTNSTAASPREATPATGEDESSESASLQQVLVVTLCLAFNMVDGFDITAMAVVASAVASDLGIGNQNLGLIFSFALAGIMCGSMLLAPISDQVGRRRAIVGSLAIVAVSVFLTAYAGSLSAFIVLRFLAGVGAGGPVGVRRNASVRVQSEQVPNSGRHESSSPDTRSAPR